jgi:hypothetical protein
MNNLFKINDKEYELKQGLKALMKFEEITGRNSFQANENITDVVTMFYCMLAVNKDFFYSLDEFIDTLDAQPELLEKYTEFMVDLAKQQPVKKKTVKK